MSGGPHRSAAAFGGIRSRIRLRARSDPAHWSPVARPARTAERPRAGGPERLLRRRRVRPGRRPPDPGRGDGRSRACSGPRPSPPPPRTSTAPSPPRSSASRWPASPWAGSASRPWPASSSRCSRSCPTPWRGRSPRTRVAIAIAFALITFMHVVFGELIPKTVALQTPDRTSLWVARPLNVFARLTRPAHRG